jgi:hypothetical protein
VRKESFGARLRDSSMVVVPIVRAQASSRLPTLPWHHSELSLVPVLLCPRFAEEDRKEASLLFHPEGIVWSNGSRLAALAACFGDDFELGILKDG